VFYNLIRIGRLENWNNGIMENWNNRKSILKNSNIDTTTGSFKMLILYFLPLTPKGDV